MNIPAKKAFFQLAALTALLGGATARAAYEDVGVGARVTGLGNAYTAVADDVYSVYYNPAGLATLERPQLGTTYSKLLGGLSDNSNLQNSFLAYAQPLRQGRLGAYGLAWNYFTLDSLYRETSLYGSYGGAVLGRKYPGKFFGGASLKYLSRSVGAAGVATNAIGTTGFATGTPDPVLANSSQGNMDLDVGWLYRPRPRWTLGLMIQHLTEPNIAFSSNDTDKLGRNVKLGGSYKTPFSTLSSDLALVKAPDGSLDRNLSLGAEKWLPTLVQGTFGIRGSLAVGSRSFRQLAAGLSYKIHRIQFDYGFTMPLGGIAGTYGTHRMGVTFRFGGLPQEETRLGEAILENMQELAEVGSLEFQYQMEDLALYLRKAVEELLLQAREAAGTGRFAQAADRLERALSLKPGDAKIAQSRDRSRMVAAIFPELKDFSTEAGQAAIYQSVLAFLAGDDAGAAKKVAYALSLNSGHEPLQALSRLILARAPAPLPAPVPLPSPVAAAPAVSTPVAAAPQVVVTTVTVYVPQVSTVTVYVPQAPPAAPVPPPGPSKADLEKLLASNNALMEVALQRSDYAKVVKLASEAILLDSSNVLAYKRLGIAYAALKNFPQALKALQTAYKLERNPEAKSKLRFYINQLLPLLEKQTGQAPGPAGAPAQTAPQDIERLYEAGVELYAQGRLEEARKMFQKILQRDPNSVSARRALQRIEAELPQGGKP